MEATLSKEIFDRYDGEFLDVIERMQRDDWDTHAPLDCVEAHTEMVLIYRSMPTDVRHHFKPVYAVLALPGDEEELVYRAQHELDALYSTYDTLDSFI